MGKLIFIDLRDVTGIVQAVALPNHKEAVAEASKLRPEWVIEVTGNVNKRPEKMIKKDSVPQSVSKELFEFYMETKKDPNELVKQKKEEGDPKYLSIV